MASTALTPNFGTLLTGATFPESSVILELLRERGAVLFRGCTPEVADFKRLSDQLTQSFMPYVGGAANQREAIGKDRTLLTVTGPKLKFGIPLHGEMFYLRHRPDILWFYCVTPALQDGETTVADGRAFYQALSPQLKELFGSRPIKYIRTYPRPKWQEVYQTTELDVVREACQANHQTLTILAEDTIQTEYVTLAIQPDRSGIPVFINNILPVAGGEYFLKDTSSLVRWEDGATIDQQILMTLKTIADELSYPITWQAGDAVLIDNTRLLHGRRAFQDTVRSIYVRLGHLCA